MASEKRKSDKDILSKIQENQNEFWKGMHELKESQRKTEESHRKTEESLRDLKESVKKVSENIDKANGNFNNKWGNFMESLIQGDLVRLLQERGIEVKRIYPSSSVLRPDQSPRWEYDLIAANGREVVVVEVKTTLRPKNIDYFLKKLADFKAGFPAYQDKTIYAAIAYLAYKDDACEKAQTQGLFTIEALGATEVASITNSKGFVPKKF